MTLSPGQKVQPNRSMRISPGGFSAFCSSILSERAPRPPRFIGQSTWTSCIGSSRKRFGIRSCTIARSLRTPSSASAAYEVEVASLDRGEIRHLALVDPVRIGDDAALGGLAEDLSQPHDRHGTGSDDVCQNLPRPDRWQLIDIADQ